jgi:hypothetical protein
VIEGKAYKILSQLWDGRAGSSAWLERGAFNPVAAGSNPARPASNTNFACAKFGQGLWFFLELSHRKDFQDTQAKK